MVADVVWPAWLAPKKLDFTPSMQSNSGGKSVGGSERDIISPYGRWTASMTFNVLGRPNDPDRMLFWRAMQVRMLGRVGQMDIGPFDQLTPAYLEGRVSTARTPFSDTSRFSDRSLFFNATTKGSLVADVARQSQQIVVDMPGTSVPRAGQYFGLGTISTRPWLHLIGGVTAISANRFSLSFWPWTRLAFSEGTAVDFEKPHCRMKFTADDIAKLEIDTQWYSEPSLSLEEVPW